MKKVVVNFYIVIVIIFSIAISFLDAAQPSPLDNLSDLKLVLPGDLSLPDDLSQKIKAAALVYHQQEAMPDPFGFFQEADQKDQKKIKQCKKKFLATLQKEKIYKEDYVVFAFLYARDNELNLVIELLVTHEETHPVLCASKLLHSVLRNIIKKKNFDALFDYLTHFQLRSLTFNCENLSSFAQAGISFVSLSDLEVKRGTSVTVDLKNVEEKLFAQVFPHVSNLDLNCHSLPSAVAHAYIKNCKNLEKIQLDWGASNIENIDIENIAEHSKDLRSIDLFYCERVSDGAIQTLVRECKKIQEINLGCCFLITGLSVRALAQHCPDLQWVSLYGCSLIQDEDVAVLLENCQKLEFINLESCGGVSKDYRFIFNSKEKVEWLRQRLKVAE